jgi:penicillin-binding protein 1C
MLLVYLFWITLPDRLFNDPYSTVLLGEEGELLGARIADDQQWRFPYNKKIPEKYKLALIHFEDKHFFIHPGIDVTALIRAFFLNLKAGKKVSGGSTLTMQLIRLSQKSKKRTYSAKIIEILCALRLELSYSKEDILTLYAAHAPFGGNIVGLEAASWFYFGRSADMLSWGESSLLAVLPNSPSLIHPGKNRILLEKKRNKLLKRLRDKGIIDELNYSLAISEPLPQKPRTLPNLAPHLLTTLIKKHGGPSPKRIFSSYLNKNLQESLTSVCDDHSTRLRLKDIRNAAAVVVDNRNARIIGYVGNTNPGRDKEFGQDVDIIQSPRSTGSILKPLLYAAMLESGDITPNSLIPDIPTQFGGFMPDNYDRQYRGAVPAKEALSQSLNIPAVRMLKEYGVHRFCDFLKKWGMTTLHRKSDEYGLTLILGGAEGKLMDLVSIYSKLSQLANPNIDSISNVAIFKDEIPRKVEIPSISTGAAYLTLEALVEVVRPGVEGFWKNFNSTAKIAWKTGTSYGLRDAWAIGISPRYTVGVWAGNADGEGKAGLTGISVAAPILFDIFNLLDKGSWFEKPVLSLKKVQLCSKSGCLPTEFCQVDQYEVPVNSHFTKICSFHHPVHLDKRGIFRVDTRCSSVEDMIHVSWFTLPPIQEFYYERHHPEYQKLPPLRNDCDQDPGELNRHNVMNLEYPSNGTIMYIPVDLDGSTSQAIFRAVHRDAETTIYWHLDEQFVGRTRKFHQISIAPPPGNHRVILVDQQGNRLEKTFRVLAKESD